MSHNEANAIVESCTTHIDRHTIISPSTRPDRVRFETDSGSVWTEHCPQLREALVLVGSFRKA